MDHLGLVAGMYDELGIGELLDQWIVGSVPRLP
ncbi:MAG TPA: hypothetical protein DEP84_08305, partial [Chloroflexi bacterium]|nr:hypothetical protein [Chloroflexota bacterium]